MNYQQEQKEWDDFVKREIGDDVQLLSVSTLSSDCRVYSMADKAFKVKRITPASVKGRLNSLEDEFLIMNRVTSISSVPVTYNYKRSKGWELLEMSLISPLPIYDPTFGQPRESLKDFVEVIKFAWSINMLGCSHGDFHFQNMGRNINGSLSVFDFDQAVIANPINCWLRDFVGLGGCARPTDISLVHRARKVQIIWPVFAAFSYLRKGLVKIIRTFMASVGHQDKVLKSPLELRVELMKDADMDILAQAWTIAAGASASAPGSELAYYSLDVCGINFPGERPWTPRWEKIKNRIDFRGKKFLELGCNLGLLATHANLNGASVCTGIDIDSDIVKAASLVSRAFGAEVEFKQLNLDESVPWEDELGGSDIISVLSVMHWVKDKVRLWSFLGRHNEIIYEGHESDSEAENNLRKIGFTQIFKIGESERGRGIFHATK